MRYLSKNITSIMKCKDRNLGPPDWTLRHPSVFWILFFLLVPSAPGPAQTAIVSVLPDADSFVRSLAPTNNYGAGGALSVSGAAAVNSLGEQNGLFDSLMRFSTSNAVASLENA